MNKRQITLRTQIFLIMSVVIFIVTGLSSGAYAVMEYYDARESYKTLSKQTANSLSHMQSVGSALVEGEVSEIEANTIRASHQTGNPIISVVDRNGTIVVHPNRELIGQTSESNQMHHSLVFGAYVTEEGPGTEGKDAIITMAPIYSYTEQYEQLVGLVTVEYPLSMINQEIYQKLSRVLWLAILSIFIGGIGAIYLSQKIKRDTLGLEPSTISNLYRQRNAMLESIKEGIVAINERSEITLMNPSARQMIGGSIKMEKDLTFIKELGLPQILNGQSFMQDRELEINNKVYIVNQLPLYENESIVGAIASFRDKTEITHLVETLTEVKQYSDDLRAQTHEYTNKLYVLMGLLELGEEQEAISFIKEETTQQTNMSSQILHTISDTHLQAILLGKLAKASEKKIALEIDENCSVDTLPSHLSLTKMVIIIGNLLDNAMEAVASQNDRFVSFFITDIGQDIVIEVKDNGPGFEDFSIVQKGVSFKGENRGFGLYNVEKTVSQLNGSVELINPDEGGAIVSVYLPKKRYKEEG